MLSVTLLRRSVAVQIEDAWVTPIQQNPRVSIGARKYLCGRPLIRLLHAYFPTRTVFLGISESCLVALAFVAATIARLGPNDAKLMLGYGQGATKILLVSAAFMICMYYFDLYDSSILCNPREVVSRLLRVLGTACVVLAVLYFLYPPLELGRGIFLIGLLLMSSAISDSLQRLVPGGCIARPMN